MKKILPLLAVLSVLLLAGCLGPRKVALHNNFDIQAAAAQLQPGPALVTGQAFITLRNGEVKYIAGRTVELIPVTPFAEERIAALYGSPNGGYRSVGEADRDSVEFDKNPDAYFELRCVATTDAVGRFAFDGLSSGDYYLTTGMSWESGAYVVGGTIARRIRISGPGVMNVILTQ